MMNYSAVVNENNLYDVIESKTGLVIKSNIHQIEARYCTRFLNFGGGFDGHTPAFLMERIEI